MRGYETPALNASEMLARRGNAAAPVPDEFLKLFIAAFGKDDLELHILIAGLFALALNAAPLKAQNGARA